MPKIAVLVSGNGSNLQAIIDAVSHGQLPCEIAIVIADRDCFALKRSELAGIKTALLDRKIEKEQLSTRINSILPTDCDLIVLAGFLSILDKEFTRLWDRKIINLHPSLLPKYGGSGMWGLKVHQAVIANNEIESGCTIHFVNSEIDGGEILHQHRVPVLQGDNPESLQRRIQQVEHKALIEVIERLLKV